MSEFADITISDDDLQALQGKRVVLALTDDGHELDYERRAAALLAAKLGATLFLQDRSQERWTDTPHVKGPADVDTLREHGIHHMVAQMEEAASLGAEKVVAFAPSSPVLGDALEDALRTSDADVVVAPQDLGHPRLLARWQVGHDFHGWLRERVGTRAIVVVHDDGRTELMR